MLLFLNNATYLFTFIRALEMKKWDNQTLMQCFEGKLTDSFIAEDEVIVQARLAFLEKNKRLKCITTVLYMFMSVLLVEMIFS